MTELEEFEAWWRGHYDHRNPYPGPYYYALEAWRARGEHEARTKRVAWLLPLSELRAKRIPASTRDGIPNERGIYFLFDEDAELQYVGMSFSIERRVGQHRLPNRPSLICATWFCDVAWITTPTLAEAAMHELELAYINAFEPPGNLKRC